MDVLLVVVRRDDGTVRRADGFGFGVGRCGGFDVVGCAAFSLAAEEEALAEVVDEEGDEEAGEEDGCCGALVA